MVQTYKLVTDYDPGAGAETKEWQLPSDRSKVIKSLIFDIIAQQSAATAATRENLAAQLDEITVGVKESPSISVIDGEDLYNNNVLLGNRPIFDSSATDNHRVSLGYVHAFDPFMMAPQIDYHQPYGMTGDIAGKLKVKFAADGGNIDSKKLTVGIITTPIDDLVENRTQLQGYLTYHKHTEAQAAGTPKSYSVPQPGKLLGVHFFEPTSFADITSDGDFRGTQDIQETSITIGEKEVQGPLPTTIFGIMNGVDVTELTDQGHSFWNMGIHNKVGSLGVPTNGRIPDDMKVKILGGNTGTVRLYPMTLNDKLS